MALSSGTRQAAGMAAAWLLALGAGAFSAVYFSEIKGVARHLLGVSEPSTGRIAVARHAMPPAAPRATLAGSPTVTIRAGAHGHYFASAEINGRSIEVLVDSGASIVALSHEDAQRAGIFIRESDYNQRVSTANGYARVAAVMLERVSVGDITVRNVLASVSEPGSLTTSLLGMSFLSRLQRVDIRSGVLHLQE
jgi:aspartyl protease family protein